MVLGVEAEATSSQEAVGAVQAETIESGGRGGNFDKAVATSAPDLVRAIEASRGSRVPA